MYIVMYISRVHCTRNNQLIWLCVFLVSNEPYVSYQKDKTTLCLKKPDTCDIFKYLQQIMTNINIFWYRESSINVQSTDLKLPCEI